MPAPTVIAPAKTKTKATPSLIDITTYGITNSKQPMETINKHFSNVFMISKVLANQVRKRT